MPALDDTIFRKHKRGVLCAEQVTEEAVEKLWKRFDISGRMSYQNKIEYLIGMLDTVVNE